MGAHLPPRSLPPIPAQTALRLRRAALIGTPSLNSWRRTSLPILRGIWPEEAAPRLLHPQVASGRRHPRWRHRRISPGTTPSSPKKTPSPLEPFRLAPPPREESPQLLFQAAAASSYDAGATVDQDVSPLYSVQSLPGCTSVHMLVFSMFLPTQTLF